MYISKVHIKNYRNYLDCDIPLNEGLTILIGENNIGKTNFLKALALIFSLDASPRTRKLPVEDFSIEALSTELDEPPEIEISCTLTDFRTDGEKSVVATWLTSDPTEARVTYVYRCNAKARVLYAKGNPIPIDDYEWTLYGG